MNDLVLTPGMTDRTVLCSRSEEQRKHKTPKPSVLHSCELFVPVIFSLKHLLWCWCSSNRFCAWKIRSHTGLTPSGNFDLILSYLFTITYYEHLLCLFWTIWGWKIVLGFILNTTISPEGHYLFNYDITAMSTVQFQSPTQMEIIRRKTSAGFHYPV